MSIAYVPVLDLFFHRGTESQPEKRIQAFADFLFHVLRILRFGKEFLPKPNRIFIEIRALQNGNAKLQKGIEKKRREGQLIGLVVEPVSGPQILGERPDLTESFRSVLGRCPDAIGDFLIRGQQVVVMTSHHLFRKFENVGPDPEQILEGIVILETVEPAEPRLVLFRPRDRLPHEILKKQNRFFPFLVRKLLLVLRRHVRKIDHLDQFLDQFRLGQKVSFGCDFLEVDLSLGLLSSMTFDAVLLKQRLEEGLVVFGCKSEEKTLCQERHKNQAKEKPRHGLGPQIRNYGVTVGKAVDFQAHQVGQGEPKV